MAWSGSGSGSGSTARLLTSHLLCDEVLAGGAAWVPPQRGLAALAFGLAAGLRLQGVPAVRQAIAQLVAAHRGAVETALRQFAAERAEHVVLQLVLDALGDDAQA